MKKNKFIKSTFILIIAGLFTKLLGMIIKIVYTRLIGDEGISLYSLVMPSYSLLLTFATFSMPTILSKIISENKYKSKIVLTNALFIMTLINILVIIIMFLFSKFISVNLLHESKCYYLLIACSLTLPFVSISSIIKGYFYGKQNVKPYAISNIIEQIVRLIIIYLFLPYFINISLLVGVIFLILFNIISECVSILIFLFFMPKINFNINYIDKVIYKDIFHLSSIKC